MALSTISGTTGITDATITSAKLADFSAAVDLNGVELLLDADQDTSITADTDDRIDLKIGGAEHISFGNSSGDTIIKVMADSKDIVFQQYDGNKILEINDGNYVAISGAAAGPGELRFYEDTDLGSHYTGFKAGNATASLSYVLPLADGTDGYQLTTDGSGTLTWAAGGATLTGSTNNTITTVTAANAFQGEANLTFDGSVLAATGNITATGTIEPAGDTSASDNAAIGYTAAEGLILTGQGSTNDVTIKNDADADVISIPTGATNVTVAGVVTATGFTIGSAAITEAELEILDGANVTTTELNLIDGGTARGTDALASGDGILINDAGTMKMTNVDTVQTFMQTGIVGKQSIWVPANAMNPTESNGCSNITAVETTSGRPDMQVLDFDKDSDEHAQFTVAFPKQWNLGTITYQVFWSGLAATTGVNWRMQGVAMNDNETIDVDYGTSIGVDDDAQGAVEELLVSDESSALTIAGTPADNDLCYFRILRDVSAGNDDMAGDARLHGVKIFYTTDALNDA
jgi:hypothetical protein